jgi:PAS domain-containing protein
VPGGFKANTPDKIKVMQESKSVLQDVFDTIFTGIFVVDVESLGGSEPEVITFRFVTTNPAYARMLSIPTATLAGLCPQECFPPDIAERFCTNYRRCLEQRQPISYEESFEFEDHTCTLLTTLFPTIEPDGRISRIIGSSQDISEFRRVEAVSKPFNEEIETTDRKRAEEALSQEKELLSTLIKNAPIGIISTDEVGKILLVNPAFERICGYSYEELVGQIPPYPYWDLADLDKINNEFRLAMSGRRNRLNFGLPEKMERGFWLG